jgi:hypothetical protein
VRERHTADLGDTSRLKVARLSADDGGGRIRTSVG